MDNESGKRLREERERLGMKPNDLAGIGGVKERAQYNYETGKRVPDMDYLAKIAKAGVDVIYVMHGERMTQPQRAADVKEVAAGYIVAGSRPQGPECREITPREWSILALCADLNDAGLRSVQDIAQKEKRIQELERLVAEKPAGKPTGRLKSVRGERNSAM